MSNYISEILLAPSDAEVRFMAPANVEKFLRVMQQLRLQPRAPVSERDLMNPEAIQRMVAEKGALVFSFVDVDRPLRHVDLFLRTSMDVLVLGNFFLQRS